MIIYFKENHNMF